MRTFQVVCMDKASYINEHKDFTDEQIGPMLRYINRKCIENENAKITIIRYNGDGEVG